MATTVSKSRRLSNVKYLLWFALSIVVVSLLLSWIVRFWIHLSLWKTFRRCVSIAAALMLWTFIRVVHGRSLRSFGLGAWREGKRQLLQGILLGCGAVLVIGGLYLVVGVCRISIHENHWHVGQTLIGFIPAVILIAVLEELVFRGYVLQQLLASSRRLAVFGSSLSYALVHLRPSMIWPGTALELIGLWILGVVLAASYLRTKQLYLAVGLHAALAYFARVNKLLVEFTNPSLQWLVGSNRLVNGVIAWLVLLGIGWVISRRTRVTA